MRKVTRPNNYRSTSLGDWQPISAVAIPIIEQTKPISERLTPTQQIALLQMRASDIAMVVLARLRHSTAPRPSGRDYHDLADMGLAQRKPTPNNHFHVLTPRGHWQAGQLARELAVNLGIDRQAYAPRPRPLMSQAGNA